MPPKRKIANTEENVPANKIKDKKTVKTIPETSTRTLRPRKVTSPEDTVQTKSVKKNDNTKKQTEKPKGKLTKQSGEEPSTKRSKKNVDSENGTNAENGTNDEAVNANSIYEFTAKDISGNVVSLEKYKGHVCIIVNVASKCGHTAPNYKEFVEIYDKYSEDKGLRILAFPCNQFGKQEPGDNEKICEFAKKRNVKFDMFEKIEVNGKNAHPLWKYLISQKEGPKGAKIDWNFTKFLINKEGHVVDRFKPSVKPSALVEELEKLW